MVFIRLLLFNYFLIIIFTYTIRIIKKRNGITPYSPPEEPPQHVQLYSGGGDSSIGYIPKPDRRVRKKLHHPHPDPHPLY
jgi:hypothetical protein